MQNCFIQKPLFFFNSFTIFLLVCMCVCVYMRMYMLDASGGVSFSVDSLHHQHYYCYCYCYCETGAHQFGQTKWLPAPVAAGLRLLHAS